MSLEKTQYEHNRMTVKQVEGPFMYPFWINNGKRIREKLVSKKIYVPVLWPNVVHNYSNDILEYDMAENILPIPCDHRYDI